MKSKKSNKKDVKEVKTPSKPRKKKSDTGHWYIFGGIAFFLILAITTYSMTRPIPTDFDSLYERTLQGKESPINYQYNGFVFVRTEQFWETLVSKRVIDQSGNIVSRPDTEFQLSLYYDPRSLEHIPVQMNPADILGRSLLVLSYDPLLDSNTAIAGVEVGKVLGDRYGIINIPVQQAVFAEYEGSFPVFSCDNATSSIGVIEFRVGESPSVTQDGDCIVLEATTTRELIAVADRFVLSLLGVMSHD